MCLKRHSDDLLPYISTRIVPPPPVIPVMEDPVFRKRESLEATLRRLYYLEQHLWLRGVPSEAPEGHVNTLNHLRDFEIPKKEAQYKATWDIEDEAKAVGFLNQWKAAEGRKAQQNYSDE